MQIKVNGESCEFASPLTVAVLAQHLNLNAKQVAVERNREIVPRSCYSDIEINDGDEIEIVHFIGGG